jgi:tRNA (guanine37-N1)-methyltransferase
MSHKMQFDILTIFPGFFTSIFDQGVLSRGVGTGLLGLGVHDLRTWTQDRHRTVDDRPFGGGEGMVLKPEPIAGALASLGIGPKPTREPNNGTCVILMSAQGQTFHQSTARELVANYKRLVFVCGRYEGVDERVNELYCDREISIGDYVLSGGELAAAIVIDSVGRLVPGVLGNEASSEFESFGQADASIGTDIEGVPRSQHGSGGLLDYPHYTRPPEFEGLRVPEVLQNGDHAAIRRWRREQQLRKTLLNRPELLEGAALSKADLKLLDKIRLELGQ